VVSAQGEGPLLDELQAAVREARLRHRGLAEGIADLAESTGIPELGAFAASVASALTIGTQLGESLRTLAESARERRRLSLVAEGGRATAKMLIPVGFLILPAFFLVLVFPAAIQMLGLAG
jgi:tight adherence protein C